MFQICLSSSSRAPYIADALLLTIVVSIPTSFDDEEVDRANQRFSSDGEFIFFSDLAGVEKNFDRLRGLYSNRLLLHLSYALNYLSISFISVVITYIILANTFIVENFVIMRAWWKYVRWVGSTRPSDPFFVQTLSLD